jgi:hypothetical protein
VIELLVGLISDTLPTTPVRAVLVIRSLTMTRNRVNHFWKNRALRRAGKLDRHAGGENALESNPGLDRNDTVGFIVQADDRIGVDIFRLADELAQSDLTPIVLRRSAARGVPGGGSLDPTDRMENAAPLDTAG